MHSITFSLHHDAPRRSLVDTASESIEAIQHMSAQTKARLELLALVVGLLLSVGASVKVWVFLPSKVESMERDVTNNAKAIVDLQTRRETDREILLKLGWQYETISRDIADIKAAVKAKP